MTCFLPCSFCFFPLVLFIKAHFIPAWWIQAFVEYFPQYSPFKGGCVLMTHCTFLRCNNNFLLKKWLCSTLNSGVFYGMAGKHLGHLAVIWASKFIKLVQNFYKGFREEIMAGIGFDVLSGLCKSLVCEFIEKLNHRMG